MYRPAGMGPAWVTAAMKALAAVGNGCLALAPHIIGKYAFDYAQ